MASSSKPLVLIAGSTQMPAIVARQARSRGRQVLAVAIQGITDPAIGEFADEVRWLRWGDVSGFLALLGELRRRGVEEAVMAGKVDQRRIYEGAGGGELDALLGQLPHRHTDALIGAVADLLRQAGIALLDSTEFLNGYLAPEGPLSRRRPDQRETLDIDHGWRVAKALGGLDIGQTVVVKARAVVAVEAMEGTDPCIRRAGELAGPGTVVVKVAKPGQDLRFDLPVVGASTVAAMVDAGSSALAVEAGVTVIFDRERLLHEADAAGLAVVGLRRG